MNETQARDEMARMAASLFRRGFSVGSAGNISMVVDDGILITPTNSSLGALDPARIAKIGRDGRHIAGDKPSKEVFLHTAFYDTRPDTGAVIHLHSIYATALSCLADIDPDDAVPPLTPYVVMRVGRVKLIPYVRPGDPALGQLIRDLKGQYQAVLLANHGPTVAGKDLASAMYASEELEETAKLVLMLRQQKVNMLTAQQIEDLVRVFNAPRF